mmetsp:Transcript_21789/g.50093  ORF Transcript_21789/g.50093 Transcript_21789/m.50093 type:complete len:273 (+) Transcript_21789:200-1018(+)
MGKDARREHLANHLLEVSRRQRHRHQLWRVFAWRARPCSGRHACCAGTRAVRFVAADAQPDRLQHRVPQDEPRQGNALHLAQSAVDGAARPRVPWRGAAHAHAGGAALWGGLVAHRLHPSAGVRCGRRSFGCGQHRWRPHRRCDGHGARHVRHLHAVHPPLAGRGIDRPVRRAGQRALLRRDAACAHQHRVRADPQPGHHLRRRDHGRRHLHQLLLRRLHGRATLPCRRAAGADLASADAHDAALGLPQVWRRAVLVDPRWRRAPAPHAGGA